MCQRTTEKQFTVWIGLHVWAYITIVCEPHPRREQANFSQFVVFVADGCSPPLLDKRLLCCIPDRSHTSSRKIQSSLHFFLFGDAVRASLNRIFNVTVRMVGVSKAMTSLFASLEKYLSFCCSLLDFAMIRKYFISSVWNIYCLLDRYSLLLISHNTAVQRLNS